MSFIISSALTKIFNVSDVIEIKNLTIVKKESINFQIYSDNGLKNLSNLTINCNVPFNVYFVKNMKGSYDINPKTDDFFIYREDDMYPDLLVDFNKNDLKEEPTVLFVTLNNVLNDLKVSIKNNEEEKELFIHVLDKTLPDTDIMITNWLHTDGICQYYHVEPFTKEFYDKFSFFLDAYVECGNTMLLIPTFTPPLDTKEGTERLTAQLVDVEVKDGEYLFNYEKLDYYLNFVIAKGIKYFELAHMFTQWGGKFAPKVIAKVEGVEKRIFGWETEATSDEYLKFIKEYIESLVVYLTNKGIIDNCYIHLTDEPNNTMIEQYTKLSNYVNQYRGKLKTMDALSHQAYENLIDMPVVAMNSEDLYKFSKDKMIYYCVFVDKDNLTNRYLHMPIIRTQVIGINLYQLEVKGFLQWGYNFYNSQLSINFNDPYVDTSAGRTLIGGDAYLVYPGDGTKVDYSVRFFAIKRGYEEYRLLKLLEQKIGRTKVLELLNSCGFVDIHTYPHDYATYIDLKNKIYQLL